MEQRVTCCFTGHRPARLPWGSDESDARCRALKQSMERELAELYSRGYRHFISGMAMGCDLYFAEAVLALRTRWPDVTLECALPCAGQAARWPRQERLRHEDIVARCDLETLVQQDYDRACMHRRDRYMVARSSAVLAVYHGSSGGTAYTLEQAMQRQLHIFLLDPHRPEERAVELIPPPGAAGVGTAKQGLTAGEKSDIMP